MLYANVDTHTLKKAAAALREKGDDESADVLDASITLAVPATRQFSGVQDVLGFLQKFEIPRSPEPALLKHDAFEFKKDHLLEEVGELIDCQKAHNLIGVADAIIDTAYLLKSMGLMMGLPWPLLWNEVHQANLRKVRAVAASQSKRRSTLDVIKPFGWVEPNLSKHIAFGKSAPEFDVYNNTLTKGV